MFRTIFMQILLMALINHTIITFANATPEAIPAMEAIACEELAEYNTYVYWGFDPDITYLEGAIIDTAWSGALDRMSLTELTFAASYFDAWVQDLREGTRGLIPAGLNEYHELRTRNIELLSIKINAYIDGDGPEFKSAVQETLDVWDQMYILELEGVRQCGKTWIDAFGEPWNPEITATPEATLRR